MTVKKIAIFASGSGTNAENISRFFLQNDYARVALILSNKKEAAVHRRAASLGIPSVSFSRDDFYKTGRVPDILADHDIDYIVLAGFLWLVPTELIRSYPGKIVNIHPALLPKYGGKGMYGMNVHRAVIENGDKESGITIHYVNNAYDEGNIIFQARCPVDPGETPESLAEKIHRLEYDYFPTVVEELVRGLPG
ncbi:MAG TPA: phosphoribosylglycinamide formyltransferase [Bacteroidales bacterium]|nr:phosphoribosylglycinamide formyltransferase [Bacteroidales bacterium]